MNRIGSRDGDETRGMPSGSGPGSVSGPSIQHSRGLGGHVNVAETLACKLSPSIRSTPTR